MDQEAWIDERLDGLRQDHLERQLTTYPGAGGAITVDDRPCLNFASNDYLDLARSERVVAAAQDALKMYGAGSTASRLLTGTLPIHDALEEALARYKGYPSAVVFGSGYMANAGVLVAMLGRDDHVYADRLAHASIIDAITLCRAKLHRFQHNDPEHLETLLSKRPASGRHLVVTESVFSMDGDVAPLSDLADVAQRNEAMLMVDEAHATGVFGPGGSGLIREFGLESVIHISMGTLSKGLGGYGGFVACSTRMRRLLIHRARSFIYTTAPPPPVIGAALGALAALEREPELGKQLLERARCFRERLQAAGLDTMQSQSQVVPVLVGDNERTLRLSRQLRERGIIAPAIRPPTVPAGRARLRLSVTLAHTEEALEQVAATIVECAGQEGLGS